MPAPALSVDAAGVRLGKRDVLRSVSLTAASGEVTAVLGPNGAGKTTLIRACTGLQRLTWGKILVLGAPAGTPGANDAVGLMPQSVGAWSAVRPAELLGYLSKLYRNPLPAGELATSLGIDGFAQTPYRKLSGGQRQLVNLAGALIGRPQLIFLDEPTAGLDPHIRHRVWEIIDQQRKAGVAVVLTTHAMDEAERLSDHLVVLDQGQVVGDGTVGELTGGRKLEEVFLELTSAGQV